MPDSSFIISTDFSRGIKSPEPKNKKHLNELRRSGGSEVTLDDVLVAEGALAGQPLALAAAAQILPVGSLGVDVALGPRTRAAALIAGLGGGVKG